MTAKLGRVLWGVFLATLVGCAELAAVLSTPTPAAVSQATATPQPLVTPTNTAPAPPSNERILRVWLPPRFDPTADTAAARLLQGRLAEFADQHPELTLEIRIKAESGDTGLLNSLSVTSAAAPMALPDLIALPRADLETAATRGLLHPMDGLSTLLDDPNWYPYARELGHIQNIGYGLPFAGNALVLLHRPELTFDTWEDIFLLEEESLSFPAGDPQALFALHLYVSSGGVLTDEQGLPALEEEPLTQTLNLIKAGFDAQTFAPTLIEIETYEQAFEVYRIGQADMVVAWSVSQRAGLNDVMRDVPGLVTSSAFADGWMWALAGGAPENQQAAVELAEFLLVDDFLGEWGRELNYLPTRLIPANSQQTRLNALLELARSMPSNAVLEVLGPVLSQAVNRVLSGEQVEVVVRSVLDQIQ